MKINEVKDIKTKFPDDYFSKDVAGKEANFNVTVHEIKEKELPKIDDEFAKDVSEFDTLKELKDDIKSKKEKSNEEKTKRQLEGDAIDAVVDSSKIDIPAGMIDWELDNMQDDMNRNLSYQGFSFEKYLQMVGKTVAQFRAESRDQAVKSIKRRLVLEAIAKDEKIEVSEKEIDSKIEELSKAYGRKVEDLKAINEVIEGVKTDIKDEKVIKVLIDNAKVKEVSEKSAVKEEKKDTKKSSKK